MKDQWVDNEKRRLFEMSWWDNIMRYRLNERLSH
jgi:hypothetical protein